MRNLRVVYNATYVIGKRLCCQTPATFAVCNKMRRNYCTIPAPTPEGVDKEYTPKIKQLVEDISRLTLIEVADFNELLKKTLNIQDTPMMSMAMPAAASQPAEEVEAKVEKSVFTVKLMQFDPPKKTALIKEIKALVGGLNLVQAKKFVESAPQVVKADLNKEEAEKLRDALTAVGATVELE
ncbi:large ribosomal subunit protein bL12m-like [Tubulanus polymorphus]|uniref:large ribosomal subunit protein bL12m-like n=1 Tax=Tubulanus polymorphus TaxID=672921 RepID=UPI003DA3F6AA